MSATNFKIIASLTADNGVITAGGLWKVSYLPLNSHFLVSFVLRSGRFFIQPTVTWRHPEEDTSGVLLDEVSLGNRAGQEILS